MEYPERKMLNHAFDAAHVPELNGHALHQQEIKRQADEIYFRLFDDVQRRLTESRDPQCVHQALDELFLALHERVTNSLESDWKAFVAQCRRHPLIQVLHQDPFTYRAFSKPRGYAGDAEMMDFIYGREDQRVPPPAAAIGRSVFDYTTQAPASEGVRARRAFMSAQIDRLAEERRRPHILSIAAGHLREASVSIAVRRRRTGRFMALDADPESAAEVQRCYACYGVETVTASFTRLLGRRQHQGEFDLVYSTGLFDYLNQRTGRRLVTAMFQMLRPGGSLIVANFLPGIRDIGYMEAFMDWNLVYRSRHDMIDLTMDIPEAEVQEINLVSEECKNIVFLQLTRN
jgi:hypothetical protein